MTHYLQFVAVESMFIKYIYRVYS